MAMNEEEVRKQLQQMVSFIKKEAEEKVNEIRIKAEEEFNIEKQKIIQTEKMKIINEFEKKEKQIEVRRKIAYSNEINQARLRVLKAREDCVNRVFHETQHRLSTISNSNSYEHLLGKLILQALIKMGEEEVLVCCRKTDEKLVEKLIPDCREKYKQKTGKEVKLSVDKNHPLAPPPTNDSRDDSCAGGVLLTANGRRILCNNTLEQRLGLAYELLLPRIRSTLFAGSIGPSPSLVPINAAATHAHHH
eukprot:TRINITY_DN242_c0_g4_i1.p1 TRINITY_DN242_c0_g4~~TRINITY_DN242_c0_g4_i1.p1  ORF type:complete len:248 (+),score=126.91 TRINITY_DN242_c0_g4_i1:166-909(+)